MNVNLIVYINPYMNIMANVINLVPHLELIQKIPLIIVIVCQILHVKIVLY